VDRTEIFLLSGIVSKRPEKQLFDTFRSLQKKFFSTRKKWRFFGAGVLWNNPRRCRLVAVSAVCQNAPVKKPKKSPPKDPNQAAYSVLQQVIAKTEKPVRTAKKPKK